MPPISYTPDSGLGSGVYVSYQRQYVNEPGQTLSRPWRWNLCAIAMAYFKPKPIAWGFAGTFSWFPRFSPKLELGVILSSHGWNKDQWYGFGNASVRDLRQRSPDDEISDPWHRFGLQQHRAAVSIYYRLHPQLDLFGALLVNYNHVTVGENTLLKQQLDNGIVRAADSGLFLSIDAGIRLDTRNSRIDPERGGLLLATGQATVRAGQLNESDEQSAPASRHSGRIAVDVRGFISPPGAKVVLAGAAFLQRQFGRVPFYELGVMLGPEAKPRHLTGAYGVRGLARGRLRDRDSLLLRGELRLRPPGFALGKLLRLRLEPIFFVDATRVGTLGVASPGPALHPSLGGGLRFIVEEQTLFRLDVGVAPEFQIDDSGLHSRWNFGLYGTLYQSF